MRQLCFHSNDGAFRGKGFKTFIASTWLLMDLHVGKFVYLPQLHGKTKDI
jgi:hypothetical protein